MMLLSVVLSLVFLFLGGIHFNWAMGGKWGFDNALPTMENGEKILNPRRIDSAIMGIGLTLFGLFYLFQLNICQINLPLWIYTYIGWIIPSIFILRAIGDFKYAGFSKKIKNTKFGKMDTKFYSPLCFGIGVIGLVIQIMK